MSFNLPTLHNFLTSDNDYVININDNFDQIYSSFSGALADVNNILSLTGTSVAADFYKKRFGDLSTGVILGPYSYVLSYSGSTLTLSSGALDDSSSAYIGGVRKTTVGDLTFDVSTLSWTLNETKQISVGLNLVAGSDTEVEMAVHDSVAPLLTLYDVEIIYKSGGYLLNRVKTRRRPVSMTWDNTLEQDRQETKRVIRVSVADPNSVSTGPDDVIYLPFSVPYDHLFESCVCYVHNEVNVGTGDASSRTDVRVINGGSASNYFEAGTGGGIFGGTGNSSSTLTMTTLADDSGGQVDGISKISKASLTLWQQGGGPFATAAGHIGIIKGDAETYYASVNVTEGDVRSVTFEIRLTEIHGLNDSSVVYP